MSPIRDGEGNAWSKDGERRRHRRRATALYARKKMHHDPA
jgi:hypothetical protein